MSKAIVLLSIIIQAILVYHLANEVFKQALLPSYNDEIQFLPLRVVLLAFIYFLFNAEQTSINKTNQLISVGKIGYFLNFMNFFR